MTESTHSITKEELDTLIVVQTKATEQMVLVATALQKITEDQKEILHKLSNGMKKEIVESVQHELNSCNDKVIAQVAGVNKLLTDRGTTITNMSNDINYTKWFIGIVGLVIVVATVILRGMEMQQTNKMPNRDYITMQELRQALKDETVLTHLLQRKEDIQNAGQSNGKN